MNAPFLSYSIFLRGLFFYAAPCRVVHKKPKTTVVCLIKVTSVKCLRTAALLANSCCS